MATKILGPFAMLLTALIGCLLLAISALFVVPQEWLALVAPPPEAADDAPAAEPAMPDAPNASADAAARAAPTNSATPAPTLSAAQANALREILAPLVSEARHRRAERESREPQAYARRVDKPFNQNRINFLVFGYGTTYEPPYAPDYKGSISIYSLNLQSLQLSTVTLNHDIRAPEIERYRHTTVPNKIDAAYRAGGFDLMRLCVEDATGLSVDFQLAFQDSVVKGVVDDAFGGLAVDMPYTFEAAPIYFQNTRYPAQHFAQGRQKMNGLQALQFIKALNALGGLTRYDPNKELAVRKQIIVKAALDAVKREATNPFFWAKALAYLKNSLERKEVEYDFDAPTLLFKTIAQYASRATTGQAIQLNVGKSIYVVDGKVGDGGVQWVTGSVNPIMQRDLRNGVYVDKAVSVPLGGADPYAADLVGRYWTSVRQLVRQKLSP